jgi:hypothetical protein
VPSSLVPSQSGGFIVVTGCLVIGAGVTVRRVLVGGIISNLVLDDSALLPLKLW